MAVTISPNMSLPIPIVGIEIGPSWASDVNFCLTSLDNHNHSSGQGVQINPNGININSDLSFNGNNAIQPRSIRFNVQSGLLTGPNDLTCLFVVNSDLYYTDAFGNKIRITQSGSVAGASGTITGLPSGTASAAYVAGSQTFVFQSATNVAANLDVGALVLRDVTPNSTYAATLQPPAALANNYSLILPTIPATPQFVTLDNTGLLGTANNIQGTQIAAASLTGAQLTAAANILGSQLAASANILGSQLAPAANILGTQIAASTITGSNIAATTVAAGNIVSNSITQTQVSTAFITTGSYAWSVTNNAGSQTQTPIGNATYYKVGNMVTVIGAFASGGAAPASFTANIPIGNPFTAVNQAAGSVGPLDGNGVGTVYAVTGSALVFVRFNNTSTTTLNNVFNFTYQQQ